ncbi:hypothetical protein K0M31_013906 [Melipona bicolor]|uniref:Uncharacterized protein n=1 Tax=Melipona bicolor TaxID=60889 RepID=A0AA40KTW5_9HYME|nr:hypothetical protein K0M31_013906 [Melipona bicolor]
MAYQILSTATGVHRKGVAVHIGEPLPDQKLDTRAVNRDPGPFFSRRAMGLSLSVSNTAKVDERLEKGEEEGVHLMSKSKPRHNFNGLLTKMKISETVCLPEADSNEKS